MITDKYVTIDELKSIAEMCESLTKMQQSLYHNMVSVNIITESDGSAKTFEVYDKNGDVLGHIGFGEAGTFVFYLDNGEE